MKSFLTALAFGALFFPGVANAGAWLQKKGDVSVSADWMSSKTTGAMTSSTINVHGPDYTQNDIQIRMEYGASDKTTVFVNPTYSSVSYSDGVIDSGINNIQVGARHLLWWKKNQVISGEVSVFIPGAPTLRSGTDVEARLLYGRGFQFAGMPAFIDAELGLRMRSEGQASEIHPDFTFGLQVDKEWQVTASSFNTYSTGGTIPIEQHKIQLGAAYALDDNLSVHGAFYTSVGGLNVGNENGASLGLTNKF